VDQGSNDLNYKVRVMREARYSKTFASVHVFGHFSSTYLYSTFTHDPKPEGCGGLLRLPLKECLYEANQLISAAIPAYSYKPKEIHPILGECFYGFFSFNEHRDGYFTNMNLPVDVPWDKKQAKKQRVIVEGVDEEVNEVVVVGVDMRDASKEWLGAMAVALGTGTDEALVGASGSLVGLMGV
jgi:hypothetical protein